MKYKDLKDEIRDLGFEDDTIFTEYVFVIPSAITRACRLIASTIKAPTGEILLNLSDDSVRNETGRYDLAELSKNNNDDVMFDSIESVYIGNDRFFRYDIEDDHIFVVSPTLSSDLTIYYNERILPVTKDTQEDFDIQVVYPCEPLVALLAAHYVWLDDDERKAILYWNEYDQLKQEIMEKAFKIKARVVGGF